MQLTCLSVLDLSNIPTDFHDNLQVKITRTLNEGNCYQQFILISAMQLWNFTNLTKLTVTHSKLQTFPPSVGRLRQLETLDLSNNELSDLPSTLAFCKKLNTLNIQNNHFRLFPSVILHLESLTTMKRLGNWLKPGYSNLGPASTKKLENPVVDKKINQPLSLQMSCTKVLLTSKLDYWKSDEIGVLQCKVLDKLSEKFCVCNNCYKTLLKEHGNLN